MEGEKKTAEQEQRAEVMSGMLENLERAGKSLNSPEAAEEYFRYLYQFKGSELDRKHIMEYFRPGNFSFASAAQEFKYDRGTHSISPDTGRGECRKNCGGNPFKRLQQKADA